MLKVSTSWAMEQSLISTHPTQAHSYTAAGPAKEQLSLKMAGKENLLEFYAILYILSYFMLFNNKFIRVGHAPQRLKKS